MTNRQLVSDFPAQNLVFNSNNDDDDL